MSVREYGDEVLTRLLHHGIRGIRGAVGAGVLMAEPVPARAGRQTSGAEKISTRPAIALPTPPDGGDPGEVRFVPRAAAGVAVEVDEWLADRAGSTLVGALTERVVLDDPFVGDLRPSAPDAVVPPEVGPVAGLVLVPGEWGGSLPLVFAVCLKSPPDDEVLAEIASLEEVLSATVAVLEQAAGQEQRADQMLQMNQYRRVVEQAKGMIMAAVGTDADSAFAVLSRASQHFNVRLRHLAVALVEHVGGAEAEHPDDAGARVEPSAGDREVAVQVWRALRPQPVAEGAEPGVGEAPWHG